MSDIKIKKGTTFKHRKCSCAAAKVTDSGYEVVETNRCVVTAVRRGVVYYRYENENVSKGTNCFLIENLNIYAEDIQCQN